MKPIALQLYTVRDAAEEDIRETLRRVADIGYSGVELCGLYGRSPSELASLLDEFGLRVCSIHGEPRRGEEEECAKEQSVLGNSRVVRGSAYGRYDEVTVALCKQVARDMEKRAKELETYGLQLGMHNHWWEFHTTEDGGCAYDILLGEAPSAFAELDVFWAAYGGSDPAEFAARYGSRIPLLHVKDGVLDRDLPLEAIFRPIGSGEIDVPAVIKATQNDTLQWIVVELDFCIGDPFEAVRESYDFLTMDGLAVGCK